MLTRRTLFAGLAAPAFLRVSHAAAAEGDLVLYNGQHRATTETLVKVFSQATGAKVTLRNAQSPELSSQIAEEGTRSPADVFFSDQSPPLAALQEKGLLVPIDAATLKTVPAEYASNHLAHRLLDRTDPRMDLRAALRCAGRREGAPTAGSDPLRGPGL